MKPRPSPPVEQVADDNPDEPLEIVFADEADPRAARPRQQRETPRKSGKRRAAWRAVGSTKRRRGRMG